MWARLSQRCKVLASMASRRQLSAKDRMVIRKTPFVFNRTRNGTGPWGRSREYAPEITREYENKSRLSCFQTTPAVIIARQILMRSAKAGPLTNQRRVSGSRPDQTSEQMTNFWDGQRDERQ